MDWPFSVPSNLLIGYWGVTASSVVFVSLSICRQATRYTSGITTKLALLTCFTLWALFRTCTFNIRFLKQNGVDSPLDFLAITRVQNFGKPGSIDNWWLYNKLGLHERTLDTLDWWWLYQACSFMVGPWNVFLITEGQRHGIKYLWAYMLLGETVSIPLASNMFYLALVLSPKESRRREVFASPYLGGTTCLSLYILSRSLYSTGPPAPQTLAWVHLLPFVPLLQPVRTRSAFSMRGEWLYHFVHVVSAAVFVPALISALLDIRPVGNAHGTSVYHQWFTIIYAWFLQSPAGQDVLCTSISFTAFIVTSGGSAELSLAVYLVLGIPFLNVTSSLALGLLSGNAQFGSAALTLSPPASTCNSPAVLLDRVHIWETGEYHFLWIKHCQIYYTAIPVGSYELDELVGKPIPESEVYAPWRESIQEAANPPSSSTFVKYSYFGAIMKILHGVDAFSQIYAEISTLEEISKAAHPSIVEYRGCLRRGDIITGICLRKYVCTLDQLVEGKVAEGLRPSYDPEIIIADIRAGLDFLHNLGLVHDDVNPRNIMLDENGRAVIIDFDACRPIGAQSRGGTPGWGTNPSLALVENDEHGLSLLRKFMRGEYDGQDLSHYDM